MEIKRHLVYEKHVRYLSLERETWL